MRRERGRVAVELSECSGALDPAWLQGFSSLIFMYFLLVLKLLLLLQNDLSVHGRIAQINWIMGAKSKYVSLIISEYSYRSAVEIDWRWAANSEPTDAFSLQIRHRTARQRYHRSDASLAERARIREDDTHSLRSCTWVVQWVRY